jgi:hypothetical protein
MHEPYKILKVSDQFHLRAEQIMSIGLCYYDSGFNEDAENSYREAIKSTPKPMHINIEII